MEIGMIWFEMEEIDGILRNTLRCPVCEALWYDDYDEIAQECPHLRFTWYSEGNIDYYGRWKKKLFEKLYRKTYRSVHPDIEDRSDSLYFNLDAVEALEKYDHPDIEAILVFTQDSGGCCGSMSRFVMLYAFGEEEK